MVLTDNARDIDVYFPKKVLSGIPKGFSFGVSLSKRIIVKTGEDYKYLEPNSVVLSYKPNNLEDKGSSDAQCEKLWNVPVSMEKPYFQTNYGRYNNFNHQQFYVFGVYSTLLDSEKSNGAFYTVFPIKDGVIDWQNLGNFSKHIQRKKEGEKLMLEFKILNGFSGLLALGKSMERLVHSNHLNYLTYLYKLRRKYVRNFVKTN